MTFPERAKKPVIILGIGGLIGLAYTTYRDRNSEPAGEELADSVATDAPPQTGQPHRLTGGFAGSGMNTNILPPTQTTLPPASNPVTGVTPAPQAPGSYTLNDHQESGPDTSDPVYPQDPSTSYPVYSYSGMPETT